jgi:transcriptional regulator with XRE-family HTH domain
MKLNTPKIKIEMARNGLNVVKLARLLGFSHQRLSYVLSNHNRPKIFSTIMKISKILNINERDLIN